MGARVGPVANAPFRCPPTFFESNQAGVASIGASQFQGFKSLLLGLLNGSPEQIRRAAEVIVGDIAAAVFVNHGFLVVERQDAGKGNAVFGGDANLDVVAEAGNQAAKPSEGLRREAVTAAGHNQEAIELFEQSLRGSLLVLQALPFGAANFSLHTVFVEAAKQLLRPGTKIDSVE